MKTMKKTLAIFLSVLMALSMCSMLGTVSFAVDIPEEYTMLPTSADGLDYRSPYFDKAGFVSYLTGAGRAEDAAVYAASDYYLTSDFNVAILFPSEEWEFDYGSGEAFAFLKYAPCKHNSLDHFTRQESEFCGKNGYIEHWRCADCYEAYFADEGGMQPLTYDEVYSLPPQFSEHQFLYQLGFDQNDEHNWLYEDPVEHELYFETYGETLQQNYERMGYTFWYCANCGVVRKYTGDNDYVYYDQINPFKLYEPGQQPPVYNEIPVSEEGLAKGDFWYDMASLKLCFWDNTDTGNIKVYLSEDGNYLCINSDTIGYLSSSRDGENNILFDFLRQVGEFDDWSDLPLSSEGLNVGDYWLNASLLIALGYFDSIDSALISPDGSQIVAFTNKGTIKGSVDSENYGGLCYTYGLKRVTAVPDSFEPVYSDKADVPGFGMYADWYALAASLAEPGDTPEDIEMNALSMTSFYEFYWKPSDDFSYYIFDVNMMGDEVLLDPVVLDLFRDEEPVSEEEFNLVGEEAVGMSYAEYLTANTAYMELLNKQTEDPEAYGDYMLPADLYNGTAPYAEYSAYYLNAKPWTDMLDLIEMYDDICPFVYIVEEHPALGFDDDAMTAVLGFNDLSIPDNVDPEEEDLQPEFIAELCNEQELAAAVAVPVDDVQISFGKDDDQFTTTLEGKKIAAYDLSFNLIRYVENEETEDFDRELVLQNLQPAENRSILVRLPVPEDFDPDFTRVFYIAESGETEEIPSRIDDGRALFHLRHCSIYALVDVSADPEFVEIPSADSSELSVGDYYFDVDSFVSEQMANAPESDKNIFRSAAFYIGVVYGDVQFIRMVVNGNSIDYDRSNEEQIGIFVYLKQHEVEEVCAHENLIETPAVTATCQSGGNSAYWTCEDCGKFFSDENAENEINEGDWITEIDSNHHVYGDWSLAVASTCTTKGYEKRTCPCGAFETRELALDPAVHEYGEWSLAVASTCTTKGYEKRTCPCGAFETRELALDPEVHEYGDWSLAVASTCTTKGYEKKTCPCGAFETRELALDPEVHEYGDWSLAVASTCTTKGYEKRTCPCGAFETRELALDPEVHEYGDWSLAVASTCTTKGYEKRTCPCGAFETRELALDPEVHEYGNWSLAVASTCTTKGYEKRTCPCGAFETRELALDPEVHEYGDWSLAVASTCTTKGYEKRTCPCGAFETRELALDSDVHEYGDWSLAVASTCTTKGYEKRTCPCGAFETRELALDPDVHEYGDWSLAVSSTCTTKGYEKRTCPCGAFETRELALDPDVHEYGDWSLAVASTCTTKGYEKRTCPCGAFETRELALDPEVHEYGNWSLAVASTCTTKGYEKRTCPCGAFETRELALDPEVHEYGNWSLAVASTCIVKGYETRTCPCGAKEKRDLDLADHTSGETVNVKNASCVASGYTGDLKCAVCGVTITAGQVIDKTDHTYGEWKLTKEATCKEEGEKSRTCSVCGKTETEKIEKTAHSYSDGVCSVCGDTKAESNCKWCGGEHTGFFGFFVRTFHSILYFFAHLFGLR